MDYRAFLNDDRAGFHVTENRSHTIRLNHYIGKTGHKAKWDSSIWVDRLEIEGPYYPRRRSIFETNYQNTIGKPDLENEEVQAKRFLVAFMREAFRRRDPAANYVDRVFQIYQLNRKNKRSIKESLVTPLAMILSSPSFPGCRPSPS